MDMFSLKHTDTNWVASCRACGHEQALPDHVTEIELTAGMAVKCGRCPSEEYQLALNETSVIPAPGVQVAQIA